MKESTKVFLSIVLCTGAVLFGMTTEALAQTSTGTVLGVVSDQSGGAVPDAEVALVSTTTGARRTTESLQTGNYEFPLVAPDTYQLTVTKSGFSTAAFNNVVVRVNETFTQNVQMSVGSTTQQVTVTAEVSKVDTSTATLGAVTGYTQITTLPILGRSFLALATLSAGTVVDYPGSWTGTFSGGRSDMAVGVSGAQDFFTTNLIDGVPTKSPEYGGIGYQLPLEMIDEFNIQRGYYSAKYPGPGVVNIASRSGANQIHGVAWETIRNNVLDSRSFFDQNIPPLRQNHFGGAFGGAIKKDKLFYFGNVQFVRDVIGSTLLGSVPTASELQGNLCDIPAISLTNPFTGGAMSCVIPQGNFDPFATKFIALGTRAIPPPTTSGPAGSINRIIQSDKLQTDNFVDFRVDYDRGSKDRFSFRFGYGNSSITQASFSAYTISAPYNARNDVLSWTHIFSPTLINEFHAGLDRVNNRPDQPFGPGIGSENFNSELGVSGVNTYKPCDGPTGVSLNNIGGGFGDSFGTFLCDITLSNNYSYNDSLVYVRGKHSLQFGTDLTRFQVTNPIFNGEPGSFTYTGQYSGNSLSDFLLGYVENANGLTRTEVPYRRSWNWGLFAEDKYQITKNLTINAGLRWELPQPAYDKQNNLAAFVPLAPGYAPNTAYTFEYAQATSATTIAGQPVSPPQFGRAIVRTNYKDFAPRVGLAWMPFGRPKWSVRASYGIFYDTLVFDEESFNSLGFPVVAPYSESGTSTTPVSTANQFGLGAPSIGGYSLSEDPFRSDPYLQQWTVSVQRQLPGSALLSVAYVGNRGTHMFVRGQVNVAHLGTTPIADRLPFPTLGAVLDDRSEAQSAYNALQVDLEKRLSHNLTFRVGYTYSNSMDDSQSQGNGTSFPWDVRAGWQRSDLNLKHNFVFSHTYVLPFGSGQHYLGSARGAMDRLVSGWESVGILSAHTGFPFSIGGTDLSNTYYGFFGGARPNRTCSGKLSNPTISEWFDTSCFSVAPPNTYGNAGWGFLDQPGYFDWDLSAVKNTKLTERLNLQFRAEFFNAFNKVNFNGPNAGVSQGPNGNVTAPYSPNPLLGVITSAGPGREIQGVLRLVW
jgi:hypothetical protein